MANSEGFHPEQGFLVNGVINTSRTDWNLCLDAQSLVSVVIMTSVIIMAYHVMTSVRLKGSPSINCISNVGSNLRC